MCKAKVFLSDYADMCHTHLFLGFPQTKLGAKEALSAIHYHLPMHCTLRYGTLLMVPQA